MTAAEKRQAAKFKREQKRQRDRNDKYRVDKLRDYK